VLIWCFVVNLGRIRKNSRLQIRRNHLEYWNDEELYIRFRLSKNTVVLLLEEIRGNIQHNTNWSTLASRLMPSVVCELNERTIFFPHFCFLFVGCSPCFFFTRQLFCWSPTSPINLFHL
jgi:hypothetical protein